MSFFGEDKSSSIPRLFPPDGPGDIPLQSFVGGGPPAPSPSVLVPDPAGFTTPVRVNNGIEIRNTIPPAPAAYPGVPQVLGGALAAGAAGAIIIGSNPSFGRQVSTNLISSVGTAAVVTYGFPLFDAAGRAVKDIYQAWLGPPEIVVKEQDFPVPPVENKAPIIEPVIPVPREPVAPGPPPPPNPLPDGGDDKKKASDKGRDYSWLLVAVPLIVGLMYQFGRDGALFLIDIAKAIGGAFGSALAALVACLKDP